MIRINLLPRAERPRAPTSVRGGFFVVLGLVVILAVIGAIWINLSAQISGLNKEIDLMRAELVKYQTVSQEVEKFKANKRSLEEKLASIDRLKAGQVGPVHMLDEVSRLLPRGIWLTSLTNSSSRLILQGYSFTNFAIADFMTQLAKAPSGRFSDVDLTFSEHATIGKVPVEKFEITCTVKL
ncbi:MAG: PilN domain-containing protein [candidate division NC10 bacterium]|nr:PilN domain-containing protein [candidate division NC10 bacterium]